MLQDNKPPIRELKSVGYSAVLQQFMHKINQKNLENSIKIDTLLLEAAIDYALCYHQGQVRSSGEPYFYHVLEVANLITDYLPDTESVIAALLHDIVEDTPAFFEEVAFIFGRGIAEIVEVLSKITNNYQLSKIETLYKLNNFKDQKRKAQTIKLIDRLHNMRTIQHLQSAEKRRRISSETLVFYVPLAQSLNQKEIEAELRDIALKILNEKR